MTSGLTVLHNMAVFIILFIPTPRTEFVYLLIMQLFCQAVVIINVFQHIYVHYMYLYHTDRVF